MTRTPEYASIPEAGTLAFALHRQWLHVLALVVLVPICGAFAAPALGDGEWLGLSDAEWFWASVVTAIAHQVIVAFVFRAQLGWSFLTRLCGKADLVVWGVIFMPLPIARPILILGLAVADGGRAGLARWFEISEGIALIGGSLAALAAALFQHAYIWVHYYCTGKPDMDLIYG